MGEERNNRTYDEYMAIAARLPPLKVLTFRINQLLQLLGSLPPAKSCDDLVVFVGEDRIGPAESLDAAGELPNLFLRMGSADFFVVFFAAATFFFPFVAFFAMIDLPIVAAHFPMHTGTIKPD
jgi:hypothetical protein